MYKKAAEVIRRANRGTAFTGAGISVESGIPPFRGKGGLWGRYDPTCLEIEYFHSHPREAWVVIKEIFYDFFTRAKPNAAHLGLAALEREGMLHTVITQNIDNLHQAAGSTEVYEFHGNSQHLLCVNCRARFHVSEVSLEVLPPTCDYCEGLLKPDFIFFGESIPSNAYERAVHEATHSDVLIVVGTTGEVTPAALIPRMAKQHGAAIIEINPEESAFTHEITDVFLKEKATVAMTRLLNELGITTAE
ncbi:MAG: NAD-dependent deacylase [candidate division Zixibacteria bacterium]|nr:NAD-dependent deacylase [candidate division Zixibacteria bacterium]